ncbi:uncharacterized protein LOC117205843 [Bombus bifarius]|uniref:Uncharacterized protein LOC117205775 n=1 Tax=Bombus bifarius TaxID=103933 RepID=A0A6P8LQA1_9HYME|nr:uncharacterized protein LOC117205775 [Bombus bifarius]XP_033300499.1 uncharacterized protein LOC117205843 [Bombus bifarius]
MTSVDSSKVADVEVKNENDVSTSELMQTNNDQNPNTSTIAKDDEETVLPSDLFAYDPANYSFCKQNSIVNTLTVGEVGTLEIVSEIREGVYGITLWPERDYDDFFEQMSSVIPETTVWKNRRPNIGDFVFGLNFDTRWIRGYVVCVIPYLKMAMVDQAKIVFVLQLATCKPPLLDMPALGGLCELTDATHKLKEGEALEFKVTGQTDNEEQDGFEILILNGDYELKATVKPYIPTVEQVGILCGDVTNGREVCITGYRNHIHLFVRPLDALGVARYNFIMETVGKCAETSPFLKDPKVGQTVLAMNTDGKYCRARILEVHEVGVEVIYRDLGRREYVDPEKLKVHPDSLEEIGYFMSKLKLQGVYPDIPPLQDIIDLLDNLVDNKVPLICTYDGIPSIDGVYLKFRDGKTLNDMICKCIETNCEITSE